MGYKRSSKHYRQEITESLIEHGLVCLRRPVLFDGDMAPLGQRAAVNVRQDLWPYGNCGLDWQGTPAPVWSLALCVLDRFLPVGLLECATLNGVRLHCAGRAVALHVLFAEQVLSGIPYWGGTVYAGLIREWISMQGDLGASPGVDLTIRDI